MPIGILMKRNKEMNKEANKEANKEVNKVVLLPIEEISSNPNQPRNHFEQSDIEELANSIMANGLLQPITVRRKTQGGYELIAGERRTKAFSALKKEYIPAIIVEYTDQQSAVLALIENLQRKDLNYFEEAMGIEKLMRQMGLTQLQVSEKLGKAQSTVANKLRLLRYPRDMQELMLQAALTERHARALLKIKDDSTLRDAVKFIVEHGYNVEQTEEYVELLYAERPEGKSKRLFIMKDMRIFHNTIAKAVQLMSQAGIQIENKKCEDDEFIQYTIRIPKYEVYHKKE